MRRPAHRPRRSRRTKSHVVEPIYKSSLAALSTTDSAAALLSTERLRHVATHTRVQETVGTINSAAFWRPLYAALDSFAELHGASRPDGRYAGLLGGLSVSVEEKKKQQQQWKNSTRPFIFINGKSFVFSIIFLCGPPGWPFQSSDGCTEMKNPFPVTQIHDPDSE